MNKFVEKKLKKIRMNNILSMFIGGLFQGNYFHEEEKTLIIFMVMKMICILNKNKYDKKIK
jgi:hypothetical protein